MLLPTRKVALNAAAPAFAGAGQLPSCWCRMAIDRLIFEGADDTAIERAAVADGMRPIFDSGLMAVLEGDTTIEEVVRCIRSEA